MRDQKGDKDQSFTSKRRQNSSAVKKRVAESNVQHNFLQKQRGQELKAMIPGGFMEQAKDVEGSNRELIHILNGTKLYITSLLEDKAKPQQENQGMDIATGYHKVDQVSLGKPPFHPETKRRVVIKPLANNQVRPPFSGVAGVGGTDLRHKRESVMDGDVALPETPSDDISPHDYYLRQAVEKLIAVTKERVMGSQGVLSDEQIAKLTTVHDLMVDLIEETRKG